jgi:hypothetical protein
MDIRNPTDLRAAILGLLNGEDVVQIGALEVSRQDLEEVTEELIGMMVDNYMNGVQPSACQSLMGRLLIAEIMD